MVEPQGLTVYTVGHSTRSFEEFVEILKNYNITALIDVRAVPRSRHSPQFNKESLVNALKLLGIKYLSLPSIGGMRHPKKDSINLALESSSFRGYADFMQTKEFTEELLKIIVLAKENCLAIMCAEALPWRCHRNLISDMLIVRHVKVLHIISKDSTVMHQLNELAHVEGTKVSYPLFNSKETSQRTLGDFGTI
ncbi:MAG: DUF488 domain-containing protein [Nitrososphaerota archaeon]|nr:DUF488 domain-containing protein [Nitrososphaerota archaeon]